MDLNIRADKTIEDKSDGGFMDVPNETTTIAIKEGRKMINDPSIPRYSSVDALKKALKG